MTTQADFHEQTRKIIEDARRVIAEAEEVLKEKDAGH